MQTIYIDVYFLINFTVDILALYFASLFSKTPVSIIRLVLSALVGAMYAVLGILLIDIPYVMYPLSIVIIVLVTLISAKGVSLKRKGRYALAFLLFEVLIGGLVYYGYCFLDSAFDLAKVEIQEDENRKLLILALLVLIAIGIIKIIISVFTNAKSETNVNLLIRNGKSEFTVDALVDSGNLASDPFDKTPVMLLSAKTWNKVFEKPIKEMITDSDANNQIRIIPINNNGTTKIYYGIKTSDVYVIKENKKEKITIVIVSDEDNGGYGGYSALLPLSALEGVS